MSWGEVVRQAEEFVLSGLGMLVAGLLGATYEHPSNLRTG